METLHRDTVLSAGREKQGIRLTLFFLSYFFFQIKGRVPENYIKPL